MCASNDKEIYYNIMVQWEEGDEWSREWGDFDLETVRMEIEDEYSSDEIHAVKIMESLEERS